MELICLCQTLYRQDASSFNKQVDLLTKYLKVVLEPIPYVFYWRYRGFWRCKSRFLARDDVHLNKLGHKYFRSLRGADIYEFSQLVNSSDFLPCICQFPNFDICCSLPSRLLCSLALCSLVVGKHFPNYKQACYFVHARFKYRDYFCAFGYVILCFCFNILSVQPLLTAPFFGRCVQCNRYQ